MEPAGQFCSDGSGIHWLVVVVISSLFIEANTHIRFGLGLRDASVTFTV